MNRLTKTILLFRIILLDIASGIDQVTGIVTDNTKLIVNRAVVPIGSIVLAGFLIFEVIKFGKRKREGEDYSKQLFAIIVLIILISLVLSAPVWLWTFVG